MKTSPRLKDIKVAACLSTLALLAGCFETKQEFTLNPDGSGKVVHESSFQNVTFSLKNETPEQQLKKAAAEVIQKAKGVDAWREVSYKLLDDGRIYFKGTAYFKNLSALDFPNQTMLDFNWETSAEGTGVLTMRDKKSDEKEGKKGADWGKLSPEERAKKIKEERAKFQQMKPMMAGIVGPMKHEVVLHTPGQPGETSAFTKDPAGALHLQFDGARLLTTMETLMNDDVWLANNAGSFGGEGPPAMDERASELMFGSKGPVRATVKSLAGASFDYDAEVAAAREEFATIQQQLGSAAVAIAPPAQGGALKSLKVVGVRLVHATDESLDLRPFNSAAGFTLSLLAELPGSVHAISDESGLDTAIANDDTDLLPDSEYNRRFSYPKLSADKASVLIEAEMNAPGPGVTGLKELSGHLRYTVAGSTVETDLGFAKLAADAKGKEHGAEIKSVSDKSDDGSQAIEIQLDLEPGTLKALYVVIGKVKTELNQRGYGGGSGTYIYTYESEKGFPSKCRLVAETYAQFETYVTPFRLENITLLGEPMEPK